MMPGEIPFFVEGVVARINEFERTAYIKHKNGNVYHVFPFTPGVVFEELKIGVRVQVEITNVLTKVYSARIVKE